MHFIQLAFVAFLAIVFATYWGLGLVAGRRARVLQNVLLVVASCVFYGWVHPWFLLLLGFSALLDYSMGRLLEARPDRRRLWVGLSLAGNLGMLGVFKYFDFFVRNVGQALESLGVQANLPTLGLLLPVGISFYTFQTLSYTLDVAKGRLAPRRNLLDYLVFVSFFSQLVAGPIERASQLLPQVERERRFDLDLVLSGLSLALWGAVKKVCLADTIAPYVDEVFMTRDPAFAMVMAAGFGFGVQFLADFSGYTDIARGSARMLGFELTENFRNPYVAVTTPEFWRRWHITLSSWVGDYVYTPLLRSGKPGPARTIFAMMTTFLVIGLWHGAAWNFVAVGLYNGLWMVAYTFAVPLIPRRIKEIRVLLAPAWLFHTLVVLHPTGLMFRETSLPRVWQHLTAPWFVATKEQLVSAAIVMSLAVFGGLTMNAADLVQWKLLPRLRRSPWFLPVQTTFWAGCVVVLFLFARDVSEDFLYFQF
ncbi:MAG: MBOAT family protein [Alphaproteobacteria bacterium]|nr:MBOAT family protein [Alphaproteobacteria bacterium]